MRTDIKRLVWEVSAGIICYELVLMAAAAVLHLGSPVFFGLLGGGMLAIAAFIHMAVTSDRTLDMGAERPAVKRATIHAVIRMMIVLAVLLATMRSPYINTVAVVVGILGLKAGAYLQPVVHKLCMKKA